MACTAAIETEIDRHYDQQLQELGDEDPELTDAIRDFQAEEVEHRNTALASGAESAPAYLLLSGLTRSGCRTATASSQRTCSPHDGARRTEHDISDVCSLNRRTDGITARCRGGKNSEDRKSGAKGKREAVSENTQ